MHCPKTDEILKYVVSTACRPRVFQIAFFKGFPNIPCIAPPSGHSVGINEATRAATPENAKLAQSPTMPRDICVCIGTDERTAMDLSVARASACLFSVLFRTQVAAMHP